MIVRSAFPHLVALALGGATALLVSCGGSNAGLIPADSASQLDRHLQDVAYAVAARNCDAAVSAVSVVATEVASLTSIDVRLRLRLKQGTNRLIRAVPHDCSAAKPTTTTTTAPTTTATTPPKTTTATATTVPTQPTEPTTPTETNTTTSPTAPQDTTGGAGVPR